MKKLFSLTALSLLIGSAPALAQDDWPGDRPIHMTVGYAPGGPVDTTARIFAKYLSEELGTSVVVENRPGASGMIATQHVNRARPDGYNISFVASPTLTITPIIQSTQDLDLDKDLTYIGKLVDYTNVLVINNESDITSIEELIEYAKAHPGEVSYGSAGVGASNHLSGELLSQRSGAPMENVPYRGNAPAMIDVMSGNVLFMFDIISSAANYIDGGKVRPLAVTSRERNSTLPDVPSMEEAGVDDYEVKGWYALTGPKGLPTPIVEKIHTAMVTIADNPDYQEAIDKAGYEIAVTDGPALKEVVDTEYQLWDEVIEIAGIETQ
ncbi:MAG TPA: tripartite tricarboxylate transporter substrate binding protein [Paenalcaligenes sp.]|nr:tripartite tricarboxylate transporter substrate binding protein [Paenalcaligenes sp.]